MRFVPTHVKPSKAFTVIAVVLMIVITLPLIFTVIGAWGAFTLGYELTSDAVIIHFGPLSPRVDRAAIVGIETISRPTGARRLVGTSIAGFYQGRWSFAETGPISLYATSLQSLTVIDTGDRRYGITPIDPAGLKRAFTDGGVGQFMPVDSDAPWAIAALSLIPLWGIGIGGYAVFYMRRLTRRIAYELTDDALLIHGSRRPKVIRYADISDVRSASPTGRPWRTFGVSMANLHWGSFSWKDAGPNLRLYSTQLRPIVLIRAGSQTYGVTPEDHDGFVAQLKQRIHKDPV